MDKTFTILAIIWLVVVVSVGLVAMYMVTNGNYKGALLIFAPLVVVGFPISRYLNHRLLHPAAK
jgi:hypothetical protein